MFAKGLWFFSEETVCCKDRRPELKIGPVLKDSLTGGLCLDAVAACTAVQAGIPHEVKEQQDGKKGTGHHCGRCPAVWNVTAV